MMGEEETKKSNYIPPSSRTEVTGWQNLSRRSISASSRTTVCCTEMTCDGEYDECGDDRECHCDNNRYVRTREEPRGWWMREGVQT